MTDKLPFHLQYGQGLKHLGLEPKTTSMPHDFGRAFDLNDRLTAKVRAQARAYLKFSGTDAMYIMGGPRGSVIWEDLVAYQKQLMNEILMRHELLGKYFTGGEYNGRTEFLLPSTKGDLLRQA